MTFRVLKGKMTIGGLAIVLKGEFPDLSISKIRYLEDQGLLASIRRTPAGYRTYTRDDVDRLRLVLSLQRDQQLSLDEIRETLKFNRKPCPACGLMPRGGHA